MLSCRKAQNFHLWTSFFGKTASSSAPYGVGFVKKKKKRKAVEGLGLWRRQEAKSTSFYISLSVERAKNWSIRGTCLWQVGAFFNPSKRKPVHIDWPEVCLSVVTEPICLWGALPTVCLWDIARQMASYGTARHGHGTVPFFRQSSSFSVTYSDFSFLDRLL